jgi:cyclic-di-GMP-binding protein
MAQNFSFDIVSKIELHEVANAINQAMKEIAQRFDFRGTKAEITLNQKDRQIVLIAESNIQLQNITDILHARLAKRNVPHKALVYGKIEDAFAGTLRQEIKLQSGIETEKCKEIVKIIKDLKLRVQASIQENQVRVSGAKKDDLQEVMKILKARDLPFHIEFDNFR